MIGIAKLRWLAVRAALVCIAATCLFALQQHLPVRVVHSSSEPTTVQKPFTEAWPSWPDEDVPYIITPDERSAFQQLRNDEEREQFIERFWARRDPTPDTIENEYRDEYYRRIVYANEQFAWDVPGWKTDRGRIYITFGPPDEINRTEGNKEIWSYRYIEGLGEHEELLFVDLCGCGDYRLTDPVLKNKLLLLQTTSHIIYLENGHTSRSSQELNGTIADSHRPVGRPRNPEVSLTQYIGGVRAPRVRFKDLEEVETHRIVFKQFPFSLSLDAVRATPLTTVLVTAFAFKNSDMTDTAKDGIHELRADVFARFIRLDGRIALTLEESFKSHLSEKDWANASNREASYGNTLTLRPGRYRMEAVVADAERKHIGTYSRGIFVPSFDDETPTLSTVVLASEVRPNDTHRFPPPLTIGGNELVPRVPAVGSDTPAFRQNGTMHLWFQVY